MITFSNRLGALPGYPLAEIPAIKRRLLERGVDVIDLGAGDNDAPPPDVAIETMITAVRTTALSKYGFQQGLPEFRQAATRWVERRFGFRFDPATEMLPLIGSKEGLAHLVFAVANPGDVAIVPEPGYQAYIGGAILAGAEPHIVPLKREQQFLLELDRVPESVLQRAKIVFVNYPNRRQPGAGQQGRQGQCVVAPAGIRHPPGRASERRALRQQPQLDCVRLAQRVGPDRTATAARRGTGCILPGSGGAVRRPDAWGGRGPALG